MYSLIRRGIIAADGYMDANRDLCTHLHDMFYHYSSVTQHLCLQ